MGVSPELLYIRNGDKIFTEALAGTRPRGKDNIEDVKLELDLKKDRKEQQEHRWVSREIEHNLNEICSDWTRLSHEDVVKWAFVQHLQTNFEGILKDAITDGQILKEFHPTPAVAGLPRELALKHIEILEKFDRGWYAGPIGWLSKDKAEFAVALRSALLQSTEAIVYGGAGIVKGSEPLKEWNEIENKLMNFTNLFTGR
jgi:menaquinone-specific isochorismate synthase